MTSISSGLAGLNSIPFYRYRVEIRLEASLSVPAQQRAVLWRGAFGAVFRPLVCHDLQLACEACSLRTACPFPRAFAPSIPPGRPEIARLRDPPRPFVIEDPHPASPSLPAATPLSLGLILVGTAVTDLPYFVVTFRQLGETGIGRSRTRFRVESVTCIDALGIAGDQVYLEGSDLVRPRRSDIRLRDLMRPGDAAAKRVRLRFVTPTDIRDAAMPVNGAPPLGAIVRRARDRVSALASFFGEAPLDCDPRAVGALADEVTVVASDVRRSQASRRSSRTGQRHEVGGLLGTVIYEGDALGRIMPWLRFAEALGVGKHATFGNGRIVTEVIG